MTPIVRIALLIIFIPLNLFLITAGGFGYLGEPYTTWAANLYNFYLIVYILIGLYWCIVLTVDEKDKPKVYEVLHNGNTKKSTLEKVLGKVTVWSSCVLAFMFGWFFTGAVILFAIIMRWIVHQIIKQYVFEKLST